MGKPKQPPVVLAVAPVSRGIGYVVFEDAQSPLDWGVKTARINKDKVSERHVESLIAFYSPDILVLEEFTEDTNRPRVSQLNTNLSVLATYRAVDVVRLKRDDVKDVFAQFGSSTKYAIARTVSDWLPELRAKVPRYRKPWMSEDHSMAIYEAAALALAYYYRTT